MNMLQRLRNSFLRKYYWFKDKKKKQITTQEAVTTDVFVLDNTPRQDSFYHSSPEVKSRHQDSFHHSSSEVKSRHQDSYVPSASIRSKGDSFDPITGMLIVNALLSGDAPSSQDNYSSSDSGSGSGGYTSSDHNSSYDSGSDSSSSSSSDSGGGSCGD